jgi:hypothetical protein
MVRHAGGSFLEPMFEPHQIFPEMANIVDCRSFASHFLPSKTILFSHDAAPNVASDRRATIDYIGDYTISSPTRMAKENEIS